MRSPIDHTAVTGTESAIAWAQEHGLLRTDKNCSVHRKPMKLYKSSQHGAGRFLCSVGRSRCKQFAATVDSFFEDVRLPFDKAIKLMYCFTRDFSCEDTAHELCDFTEEDSTNLSSATISAWYQYCREMVVDHLSKIQAGMPKLGGISESGSRIIVQIDEAKFGKRKYNRGRRVEGHWVLGIVDTKTNDCRMIVVENREASTLIDIIDRHVIADSEIHTDSFKSYAGLTARGYIHKTVNHSIEFVASDGTHTQKIESNWRPAKDWMRGRARFHDDEYAYRLCEFLWRRFCKYNKIDMMSSLMDSPLITTSIS
ncbi:uncharacterized protein LOC143187738 [Calliopsis andreniformis]|uniref:uncharacterized protein LOC143187738 n=1 Tax=Calliopsis andreniformis TaxID=337506 RepID=UPI003FCD75F6